MKRLFVVWSCCALLFAAGSQTAMAETLVRDCSGCVIGIFDDPEMTSTEGYWHYLSPVKTIWVGIQYAPEFDLDGLSGVELSIDGLYQLPEVASVNFDVKHNPAVIIGNDIRTPDPSLHRGEGGINAAWNGCVVGDIELIEITLLSFQPITEPIELTITRKFPASSQEAQAPLFTDCNAPIFEQILVTGGSYTLYPLTSVSEETWSRVKGLYKE